jgi:hypothetical protein
LSFSPSSLSLSLQFGEGWRKEKETRGERGKANRNKRKKRKKNQSQGRTEDLGFGNKIRIFKNISEQKIGFGKISKTSSIKFTCKVGL